MADVLTAQKVAARTEDAVKVYGKGQTEVRALDGVTVEFAAGRCSRWPDPVRRLEEPASYLPPGPVQREASTQSRTSRTAPPPDDLPRRRAKKSEISRITSAG